ncbi:MAG: hypothetical protein LLG02_00640 [Pelosinus sp.]|nr:hypothetical protein [Pelosinus sp.]
MFNVKKYPDGTWLTIEGTLQIGKYEDKDAPYIKVNLIKEVPAPNNPYVFPYDQ